MFICPFPSTNVPGASSVLWTVTPRGEEKLAGAGDSVTDPQRTWGVPAGTAGAGAGWPWTGAETGEGAGCVMGVEGWGKGFLNPCGETGIAGWPWPGAGTTDEVALGGCGGVTWGPWGCPAGAVWPCPGTGTTDGTGLGGCCTGALDTWAGLACPVTGTAGATALGGCWAAVVVPWDGAVCPGVWEPACFCFSLTYVSMAITRWIRSLSSFDSHCKKNQKWNFICNTQKCDHFDRGCMWNHWKMLTVIRVKRVNRKKHLFPRILNFSEGAKLTYDQCEKENVCDN